MFIAYLRGLFRRHRANAEADDELRFHVDQETAANIGRGLAPEEARRVALRDIGGFTQTRESVRAVRTTWLDILWQDVRHAARMLRRSPSFAAVAILVLALGIGVNTAVFSIVNAVFFRPLAIADPDSLVYIYRLQMIDQRQYVTSTGDLDFFQPNTGIFSGFSAHWGYPSVIAVDGESDTAWGEWVLANYFDLLGVKPMLGRTLSKIDDEPSNTDLSVVISHDLWVRRFKSDPNILGKPIRMDSKFFKVAGVMGPEFVGLSDPWRPSRWWATGAARTGQAGGGIGMGVIGRLKPGATLRQAQALIAVQASRMQQIQYDQSPQQYRRKTFRAEPYLVHRAADVQTPFDPDAKAVPARLVSAVAVVVAVVLLIAAANIAGILLARGVARTTELAVRQALGAGGRRLVGQLLTESVLLSCAGGLGGLLVAWLGVALYRAYTPGRFLVDVPLDGRVLLFTAAVCLGTGVLVGLTPALQARRVDVVAALGGGVSATRRVRRRLRHGIVIPQVALAVTLLVVAGVHVRTLTEIESRDLGYRADDVVTLEVDQWDPSSKPLFEDGDTPAKREAHRAFVRNVYERIRDNPGIDSAAIVVHQLPVFARWGTEPYTSQEAYFSGSADPPPATSTGVSPGYFRTIRMSLLRGRDFDDRDTFTSPRVAIISESLARRLWPAAEAVGKSITSDTVNQKPEWREVVGVVNDVSPILPDTGDQPWVYTPVSQLWNPHWVTVIARGPGSTANLFQAMRTRIASVDTFAQVMGARTMKQMADELLYPRRTAAGILMTAGLIGLLLSSVGLYGVVSYSVAQRMREIGIRATLGADRRDLLMLVIREGVSVAVLGTAPGLGLSLIVLRLTSTLVGPVPTRDDLLFVAVSLVIAAVVLVASYVPARRAARVNPMVVLRGL